MRVGGWDFAYEPFLDRYRQTVSEDDATAAELAILRGGDFLPPADDPFAPETGTETFTYRWPTLGFVVMLAVRWDDRTAVVVSVDRL